MKKFIIINGTEMFITNKESLKEANETAVEVCDQSKEIIVREVTEITDFTAHKIEEDTKEQNTFEVLSNQKLSDTNSSPWATSNTTTHRVKFRHTGDSRLPFRVLFDNAEERFKKEFIETNPEAPICNSLTYMERVGEDTYIAEYKSTVYYN